VKSTRSGSLFLLGGQYVDSLEVGVLSCFFLHCPLGVISLDPQSVCLAL
jgi:hypothetical protein